MSRRVDQYVSQIAICIIFYYMEHEGTIISIHLISSSEPLERVLKVKTANGRYIGDHWKSEAQTRAVGKVPGWNSKSRHYKNKHVLHDCASPKKYHP